MPDAGRTHGPPATKKAGGSDHRFSRSTPAFPAQWFYGLYELSPVTGLFCHRPPGLLTRGLIPASGDQDHSISPCASVPLVQRHQHAHRIPRPTLVTIA